MSKVLMVVAFMAVSGQAIAEICTRDCLVEVVNLQLQYAPGDTIRAVIRSRSDDDLLVSVTVDALNANVWREVLMTVSDRDHPFGKPVRLLPLSARGATEVVFDACSVVVEDASRGSGAPHDYLAACGEGDPRRQSGAIVVTQRLRITVYRRGGELVQEVASSSYKAVPLLPRAAA
jgi:hypothetical protein